MRDDFAEYVGRHIANPGQCANGVYDQFADYIDLAFCRIGKLNVERNIAAIDLDVFHRPASDEILASVWIDRSRKRSLDLLF